MCGSAILVINQSSTNLSISRWWDKKQATSWEEWPSREKGGKQTIVRLTACISTIFFPYWFMEFQAPFCKSSSETLFISFQLSEQCLLHTDTSAITRWTQGIKDSKHSTVTYPFWGRSDSFLSDFLLSANRHLLEKLPCFQLNTRVWLETKVMEEQRWLGAFQVHVL